MSVRGFHPSCGQGEDIGPPHERRGDHPYAAIQIGYHQVLVLGIHRLENTTDFYPTPRKDETRWGKKIRQLERGVSRDWWEVILPAEQVELHGLIP